MKSIIYNYKLDELFHNMVKSPNLVLHNMVKSPNLVLHNMMKYKFHYFTTW